jgi:hypothetical protein
MSTSQKSSGFATQKPNKDSASRGQFRDVQSLLGNAEMQKMLQSRNDGWASFVGASLGNLQLDGMQERYAQASNIEELIASGVKPEELGIDPTNYRLRNIAEMSDVAKQVEGSVDRPAAHSLRDANMVFYTLFANKGGSMEGMDMERYREIAAMPGEQAAEKLPEFEAESFEKSTDPGTKEFGKALSVENRRKLFMMHNKTLSPRSQKN